MNHGATSESGSTLLDLVADQKLLVEQRLEGHSLRILAPDGTVRLAIEVTDKGPVLRFEGPEVRISAQGDLAIDAQTVAINGRAGLQLSTGGDVNIRATGEIDTRARTQNIEAILGDVRVRANDDVKLDGERIRMNC